MPLAESTIDVNLRNNDSNVIHDMLRERALEFSKTFKTSWVELGQTLFAIYQDKHFKAWGYEKFEHYTEKEVGLTKQLCLKLLKTYSFLEQDEPSYLKDHFALDRDAYKVPGYEEINLLRLAKRKKEVLKDDYRKMKSDIFERGKNASMVRKDLTTLMKERKFVDPDEEREQRNRTAIKKCLQALSLFKKDMDVLKLIPNELMLEVKLLRDRLEKQMDD
ncbi:MAG: hypothetical protein K8S27_08410 [Candidatus Omnitrophica bacterium]|nr:hypothetical protein [Candidatus Omnitrophota bacterium]